MFVIAAKIDRDQAGIAIVEGEGKARKLLGERFVAGWEISYQGGSPPILTNSGNRAWLAFRETTEAPKLLDLKTAEFVDSLPHPEFSRLRAVSDDGRVFTSVALPMGDRPIMAYTRGAHNMQNPLKVSHITVLSPEWAITDAGTIWAIDASGSPACFNGQEWQAVPTGSKGNTQVLLPGRGQVMLVCDDRQATFYSGSTEVASGELLTSCSSSARCCARRSVSAIGARA